MRRFKIKVWHVALAAALVVPLVVLAQETVAPTVDVGPTWKGIPLMPVITLVLSVLGTLWALAQRKIAAANEAAQKRSDTEAAFIRLGAIAFAMAGDLWTEFSAEFQKRIADGKIDAEDRLAFVKLLEGKVQLYTSKAELEKIAVAVGLPIPGVLAWLAEWVIDRLTKAHDAANTSVSAGAYPVAEPVTAGDPTLGG